MEPWIKKIADQARQTYGSIEIKTHGKNHYLHKATSKRIPGKKHPQKITGKYLGKITPQGLITPQTQKRTIYEYLNSTLLTNILNEITPQLKQAFPNQWQTLYALAITKTIRNTPLKYTKDAWKKLYHSTKTQAALSRNTLTTILRIVGADWQAQHNFFNTLIKNNQTFYFDLSSIFSRSKNLNLAERGYNKEHRFLNQINFALLLSKKQNMPVMLKTMPGSIRDVKALEYLIAEFALSGLIAIMDRGGFSKNNVNLILAAGGSFIFPLKRNSAFADFSVGMVDHFMYRERGISFGVKEVDWVDGEGGVRRLRLFVFEDALMGGEEKSNLIKCNVWAKVNGRAGVVVDESCLGKVVFLTDLDWGGEQVFLAYKGREDVEVVFDALLNELENDKTYLGDADAVRGYFFVSFLSLYLYFGVLERLRAAGLVGEVGVNELLFLFSKVYVVVGSNGREMFSEVPKKVETLIKKLNLTNVLPYKLCS